MNCINSISYMCYDDNIGPLKYHYNYYMNKIKIFN